MMNWTDIRLAVNLLCFCVEYAVVLYIFASLERQNGRRRWLGYFCLALVAALYFQPETLAASAETYSAFNLLTQGGRLLFYWAAVSGYLWLTEAVSPSVCLYLAGFYTSFYTVSRGLSAIGGHLCRNFPILADRETFHRLWMTVMVLTLEFLMAFLVRRVIRLEEIRTVGRARVGLILMTNFLVLYFKYSVITLQSAEGYAVRLGDAVFYPLCAMASVLAFLILFESFQAGQERQRAMETDRLAQQFESRYAKRSTQAQEDIRRIYHDMKNHLLAIRGLDCQKQVSTYVDTLLGDLADFDACVSTGLSALDAVFLSEKIHLARLDQVQFSVCLDLEDLNFIAYVDLISIFGNAVDNALEAVHRLPPEAERVVLLKSSRFANAVIFRVGNPYAGELRWDGKRLLTGKANPEQHGIGLNSIVKAAERYQGSVDVNVDEEGHWFELTILLPLT